MMYVLVLLLLISSLSLWQRSFRLRQVKKMLQQYKEEREMEMKEKDRQLETQTVEFFSQISHEFRSHLTLIMLPVEHLLENCRDKEEKKRLDLILRNSQQMLNLINRLPHLYHRFFPGGDHR
jgi:signal transduction histidine kinase